MRLDPKLKVHFFRTGSGREPAREFLQSLTRDQKRAVGEDIKEVQFEWPVGMPRVRKMEPDLREVRSQVEGGIVRTLFTIVGDQMVLLHAFRKKSSKTPAAELAVARQRLRELQGDL